MSFSRNTASYFSRPKLRNQTAISMLASPNVLPVAMIIQVRRDVEANRAEAVGLPMQGIAPAVPPVRLGLFILKLIAFTPVPLARPISAPATTLRWHLGA